MSGPIRRVIVRFVGFRDVDDSQYGVIATNRTCASCNNLSNFLARPECAGLPPTRAVAPLIRVAASFASALFSKPNSAEYLRLSAYASTSTE
jgi:hypothetical protein